MRNYFIYFSLLVGILFAQSAQGASITLTWTNSVSTDTVRHCVKQSLSSGNYSDGAETCLHINSSPNNRLVLSDLSPGVTYFFVVHAVDGAGNRSTASHELRVNIAASPSPTPTVTHTATASITPTGTVPPTATPTASLSPTLTPVFTPITTPSPTSLPVGRLRLLSPNGGERYVVGGYLLSSWKYSGSSASSYCVRLNLLQGTSILKRDIGGGGLPSNGSIAWRINSTVLPGDNYRIGAVLYRRNRKGLCGTQAEGERDESDNFFSIVGAEQSCPSCLTPWDFNGNGSSDVHVIGKTSFQINTLLDANDLDGAKYSFHQQAKSVSPLPARQFLKISPDMNGNLDWRVVSLESGEEGSLVKFGKRDDIPLAGTCFTSRGDVVTAVRHRDGKVQLQSRTGSLRLRPTAVHASCLSGKKESRVLVQTKNAMLVYSLRGKKLFEKKLPAMNGDVTQIPVFERNKDLFIFLAKRGDIYALEDAEWNHMGRLNSSFRRSKIFGGRVRDQYDFVGFVSTVGAVGIIPLNGAREFQPYFFNP